MIVVNCNLHASIQTVEQSLDGATLRMYIAPSDISSLIREHGEIMIDKSSFGSVGQ